MTLKQLNLVHSLARKTISTWSLPSQQGENHSKDEDRFFFKGGEQTKVNMEPGLEPSRHSPLQEPPSSRAYISKSENEDQE